ncbi:Os01g0733100 [Oryza sativa Japonica Group]|uniref:Os01g0733100 protein n=1 Tax=Oryza sativa subsp. japonica TaxID=39947 RepID=A0A0P0V7T6_ORYSJ|nr:Os01g0733100 [Oryza sativa Japonica Group]
MAAKMVLVRAVSLHTVAMAASACGSDCSPAPRSTPTPSTGSSSSPRDALKLRVCANPLVLASQRVRARADAARCFPRVRAVVADRPVAAAVSLCTRLSPVSPLRSKPPRRHHRRHRPAPAPPRASRQGTEPRPSSLCRDAPVPLPLFFPNRQRGKPLSPPPFPLFPPRRRHPPATALAASAERQLAP